jgi:hypothetical protein
MRPEGEWRLWLSPGTFVLLRDSGELHMALLLARMVDSLRFGIAAAWLSQKQTHAMADQQRYSLIFHLAAVLNEIEDWRKKNQHEIDAFAPFQDAFAAMDAVSVEPTIRAAMGRLRNKIVSHFDSSPFEQVISRFPTEGFAFAEGRGEKLLSDSNDLANAVVAFYALAIVDFSTLRERTLALLNAVVARANAFASRGRGALHSHLVARGATFETPDLPPTAL